jgi:hypothetical protein
MQEPTVDELSKELEEVLQDREVAIQALREIATQQSWPTHFGGPTQAMQARAHEALRDLHVF